jgi:hypothetical protein
MAQVDRHSRTAQLWFSVSIEAFQHFQLAERGQPAGRRTFQIQLSLLQQLQCGSGRKRLGHRRDPADRVDRHRRREIDRALSERAFVERIGGVGDHRDHARHIAGVGRALQYQVDLLFW